MIAQKKARNMNEKTSVTENTYKVMNRVWREMLMLKVFLVKAQKEMNMLF